MSGDSHIRRYQECAAEAFLEILAASNECGELGIRFAAIEASKIIMIENQIARIIEMKSHC